MQSPSLSQALPTFIDSCQQERSSSVASSYENRVDAFNIQHALSAIRSLTTLPLLMLLKFVSLLPRPSASVASATVAFCNPSYRSSSQLDYSNHHRIPTPNFLDNSGDDYLCKEICKYNTSLSIQEASTPPSSWYTSPEVFDLEREAVFGSNFAAADIAPNDEEGSFRTGELLGQPYLLTRPEEGGPIQAFYNVCTHAGSCLVGTWTNQPGAKLSSSLVGQPASGTLKKRQVFQCPYHGWEFGSNGQLRKATSLRGIQDFRSREFDLRPIPVKSVGPIAFLGLNQYETTTMERNIMLLERRLALSGFQSDLMDLGLVETMSFTVGCNWKVFVDNYGDGCYHCSYAHPDLSANIDESSYTTEILSNELSVQHAPPSAGDDERFGDRPAVYAQFYPNIMFNRYGYWLDVDLIKPIDSTTCTVFKAWFLEREFQRDDPEARQSFIRDSLAASLQIHDEDVFLCENVQRGLRSTGFDRSRYVPSKQIGAFHFHQRLAQDLHSAIASRM